MVLGPKQGTRFGKDQRMGFNDFIRERRYLNNVSPGHHFLVHTRIQMAAL